MFNGEKMKKYSQYWDGSPEGWTIAESEHYILRGEFEEAVMYQRSDNSRITTVGDFHGDPVAGIIDENERFCVIVGCGVIVYKLQAPFEEYMYDKDSSQWYEFGRDPKKAEWITAIEQISPNQIELIDDSGNHRVCFVEI